MCMYCKNTVCGGCLVFLLSMHILPEKTEIMLSVTFNPDVCTSISTKGIHIKNYEQYENYSFYAEIIQHWPQVAQGRKSMVSVSLFYVQLSILSLGPKKRQIIHSHCKSQQKHERKLQKNQWKRLYLDRLLHFYQILSENQEN